MESDLLSLSLLVCACILYFESVLRVLLVLVLVLASNLPACMGIVACGSEHFVLLTST